MIAWSTMMYLSRLHGHRRSSLTMLGEGTFGGEMFSEKIPGKKTLVEETLVERSAICIDHLISALNSF